MLRSLGICGMDEVGRSGCRLEGGNSAHMVTVAVRAYDGDDLGTRKIRGDPCTGAARVYDHAGPIADVGVAVGLYGAHNVEADLVIHQRTLRFIWLEPSPGMMRRAS